jgi:mediator of RNA polymerase II transcription subunit 12
LHSEFNVSIRPAQEAGAIKPMPLPPRPGQYAPPTSTSKTSQTHTNNVKKDARPKPFTLEIPSTAPSFPANGKICQQRRKDQG